MIPVQAVTLQTIVIDYTTGSGNHGSVTISSEDLVRTITNYVRYGWTINLIIINEYCADCVQGFVLKKNMRHDNHSWCPESHFKICPTCKGEYDNTHVLHT